MPEELEYEITSKSQLAAFQQAISAIKDISTAVDKMGNETQDAAKEVDDLNEELEETVKLGGRMKGALGGIGSVAGKIGLGVGTIAGAFGAAMVATQNWQLTVEKISTQFSISLDDAAALAASWERAGLDAQDTADKMSGLQGRLIGELEARAEAEKQLASIARDRQGVLEDIAQSEIDFNNTIAELEAERAKIDGSNVEERRKRARDEIDDLRQDYELFVKQQTDLEREETATFEKIWEDRAQKFVEASEKLRDKFSQDSRKARNVREFRELTKNFNDQRQALIDNLQKEQKEQTSTHDKAVKNRAEANEREKVLMLEKTAAVEEAAARDVAKLEEGNMKAVSDLNKRIEQEKAAYGDRTAGFNEQLATLSASEAELANQGGGLAFVMKELGVSVFDSEGNMRDFNDIIWDVQGALQGMEDSGKKAALISDLGLEDSSVWLNRGTNEIDNLRFVQEKNLQVTEESLDAIIRQRQALNEARLAALGYANSLNLTEKANTAVVQGMNWTNEAIVIAQGLWNQLKTIVSLLWQKVIEAAQIAVGLWNQVNDIVELGAEKLKDTLGFGDEGFFSQLGSLFGFGADERFQQGTRSVPGVGPRLAVVEGGEEITTRAEVVAGRGSRSGGNGLTININAPVFGVDDLNNKIQSAVTRYDRGAFAPG